MALIVARAESRASEPRAKGTGRQERRKEEGGSGEFFLRRTDEMIEREREDTIPQARMSLHYRPLIVLVSSLIKRISLCLCSFSRWQEQDPYFYVTMMCMHNGLINNGVIRLMTTHAIPFHRQISLLAHLLSHIHFDSSDLTLITANQAC